MKRGGALLALILAISGVLRVAGPGSAAPSNPQLTTSKTSGQKKNITTEYADDLRKTIHEFYGDALHSSSGAYDHWEVPGHYESLQTVIAILPDPLHTRLALSFDRGIEAIQQAAERKGYIFDRAILPWDRTPVQLPDDLDKRLPLIHEQKAREQYPGLLIFRGPGTQAYTDPLFVFVVGETPTGGLRKTQFQNAVTILNAMRNGKAPHGDSEKLLILGPTTSGALRTLDQELQTIGAYDTYIYSGTVTDADSMQDFIAGGAKTRHFTSFLENDDYTRKQFLEFACQDGYNPKEIAVLSESETVYGTQGGLKPPTDSAADFDSGNPNPSDANASDTNAADSNAVRPSTPQGQAQSSKRNGESDHPSVRPSPRAEAATTTTAPSPSAVAASSHLLRGCADYPTAARDVVNLRFPREISYFRSAYQKASESQAKPELPSGNAGLHVDSEETGTDDDAALPYAGVQTPPSQEAVMLGIVSELQKHHIKFTILYASDPLDELFLAGYLRSKYPQGRVVITTPDLMLTSQENNLLRGVLGLSVYPLSPGLTDNLCPPRPHDSTHDDRLFVSSSSVGMFNAMIALLAVDRPSEIPLAEYGTPILLDHPSTPPSGHGESSTRYVCERKPLVWVTMLGRDGFWPVTALADHDLFSMDHKEPLLAFDRGDKKSTLFNPTSKDPPAVDVSIPSQEATEKTGDTKAAKDQDDDTEVTPPAWRIAYCLCLLVMIGHLYFSLTGSILADSEARAQFAHTGEARDVVIIGLGALALATAFVTVMFTRNPVVHWSSFVYTFLLWSPLPIFLVLSFWDYAKLRHEPFAAWLFGGALAFMFLCELIAWFRIEEIGSIFSNAAIGPPPTEGWRFSIESHFPSAYWSTRLLHLASGVSPVLPILLLAAAGYWWMWQCLRGVTLVDLRRPRLPDKRDPEVMWHRINDGEAEELRTTAHPLFVKGGITIAIASLFAVVLVMLELKHPIQTIEGISYDWCYTLCLSLMIVALLTCLMKLVWTWSKCQQILAGLDRLPLRDAFSRMKHLSWSSLWTPGGSSMRATYKVMSRGLDNLQRLQRALNSSPYPVPFSRDQSRTAVASIDATLAETARVLDVYTKTVEPTKYPAARSSTSKWASQKFASWLNEYGNDKSRKAWMPRAANRFLKELALRRAAALEAWAQETVCMPRLIVRVGALQRSMANTAAVVVMQILKPWWDDESGPVVSTDEGLPKKSLPELRALAEEYAALVYVNFLITVLLRMRTLVITAIGMFVFIVLSMNVYPFEPHPALQSLAVVLLILMGAAVGYVYAAMHRDPILSRLTSTNSGELGWDFWMKLASAGAIPVFSLLAVQFPEINQFLFSWLEPALQAVK